MEVRFRAVARVADQADDLTTRHPVTDLDAQTARLKMSVEREPAAAEIQHDIVAAHRLERNRYGSRRGTGNVFGNTVFCRGDHRICNGEHRRAIRAIAPVVFRVPAERLTVRIALHPVDPKSLRDASASFDSNEG